MTDVFEVTITADTTQFTLAMLEAKAATDRYTYAVVQALERAAWRAYRDTVEQLQAQADRARTNYNRLVWADRPYDADGAWLVWRGYQLALEDLLRWGIDRFIR